MSTLAQPAEPREQQLSDLSRRGLAIYDEQLREFLEREHLGKVVAIHPDTGDYALADNSPDAMRALIERHPEGQVFIRRVGPPTPGDLRLATRIAGAEAVRGK